MTESPGGSPSTAGTDLLVDPSDDQPTPEPRNGRGYRALIEWTIIVMAVLLCTVLLRTYVVQSFSIPSLSMYPTLQVGDRIIVNKLSYHLHGVQRGDIVVFARPPLEDQEYA